MRRHSFRERPIDIYKKMKILRSSEEFVFEDETGAQHHIGAGGEGGSALPRKRIELPTPDITGVADYAGKVSADFKPPSNYIRHRNKSQQDELGIVDFDLRQADMDWLRRHPRFGDAADPKERLNTDQLERMIDLMEKDAGQCARMISQSDAAQMLNVRMPEMKKEMLHKVLPDVYTYWCQQRQKLKKPLLRRYWPATSVADTNPHNVFRPREKERYKLRRHRRDDMESYRKMMALMWDLISARGLVELVRDREKLKRQLLDIAEDQFDQAIYDLTDTSGKPRKPRTLLDRKLVVRVPKANAPEAPVDPSASAAAQAQVRRRQQARRRRQAPAQGAPLGRPRAPERQYEDGLGLGLALGLRPGFNYLGNYRQSANEEFFGRRIARRDHGGVGVVFRSKETWEEREGLISGIGAGAGQHQRGTLNLQPERQRPFFESFPPSVRVPGVPSLDMPEAPLLPAPVDELLVDEPPAVEGDADMGEDADTESEDTIDERVATARRRLAALLPTIENMIAADDDVDLLAGELPVGDRIKLIRHAREGGGDGAPVDGYVSDSEPVPFVLRPRVARGGRVMLDRVPISMESAPHVLRSRRALQERRDRIEAVRERRLRRRAGLPVEKSAGSAGRRKRRRLESHSRVRSSAVPMTNRKQLAIQVAASAQQARAIAAATHGAPFDPLSLMATATSEGVASSSDDEDDFEALAPYGVQPTPLSKGGVLRQMFVGPSASLVGRRQSSRSTPASLSASAAAAAAAAAATAGLPVADGEEHAVPELEAALETRPKVTLQVSEKRMKEILSKSDSEDEMVAAMIFPRASGLPEERLDGRCDWDVTLVS